MGAATSTLVPARATVVLGAALVTVATRLERTPVPYLSTLRGRAAESPTSFRPFAAVERLAAACRSPLGLAPLWAFVFSARHTTRCRSEGPWRQG